MMVPKFFSKKAGTPSPPMPGGRSAMDAVKAGSWCLTHCDSPCLSDGLVHAAKGLINERTLRDAALVDKLGG